MTEPVAPVAVGIVALSVALAGPLAGPYFVILLAALAGALWALAAEPTANRADAALLVFRLMLTATVLAGGLAWWLEHVYQWPAHQVLAPAAFIVGMGGNRWRALIDAVIKMVASRIGGGTP